MEYYCSNCGKAVSFGEAICPYCNEDVTGLWERMNDSKKSTPKVAPGMGGMDDAAAPFPSPSGSKSPFPPAKSSQASPFPPVSNESNSPFPSNNAAGSPFPPAPNNQASSFPAPSNISQVNEQPAMAAPFPPGSESKPFPPIQEPEEIHGPHLEIPRIGAKIPINDNPFQIGRLEIQNAATKDLPDLNAYKNISRRRADSEHFIIHLENNQYLIQDIHSTNGTYLGSTKLGPGVPPQPLKNGDKIIVPIEEFGKMVQLEIFFKM